MASVQGNRLAAAQRAVARHRYKTQTGNGEKTKVPKVILTDSVLKYVNVIAATNTDSRKNPDSKLLKFRMS